MAFAPQAAIDAGFATFGVAALVVSEADRPVTVIRSAPDILERFGAVEITSRSLVVEIRKTELGAVTEGSILSIDGELRRVQGPVQYFDHDRLIGVLNTSPVAP